MKNYIVKLLKYSEKYTKTDMTYFASNGLWLLLAQGVASTCAFVVTVVLTNTLPKEMFGQYRFVLSVVTVLAIFTLPGVSVATTRAVARGAHISLKKLVKIKINYGLLGTLAALLTALYYYQQGNELLANMFALSALFIPFFDTFFIYSFYLKGKHDFKTPATYEVISRIIQVFSIIAVVLITKNILLLIATFFITQIATRAFFFHKTTIDSDAKDINEITDKDSTKDVIYYGKHLSTLSIFGIAVENVDKLFVWHFLGADALAIYIIALAIPITLSGIFSFASELALPKFAAKTTALTLPLRKMLIFALSLTVVAVMYIATASNIFHNLFPLYIDAILFTQIMAITTIIVPVKAVIGKISVVNANRYVLTAITIIPLILQIVLLYTFVLYMSLGILGAVLALVVRVCVMLFIDTFFTLFILKKQSL